MINILNKNNINLSNYRFGFTLAEVLITLGVIGVVAALTMPMAIDRYNEVATVSKVKKIYSTLGNAMSLAVSENGTVDTWFVETAGAWVASQKNTQGIASNIVPQLKVLKDCGFEKNCMMVVDFKFLNGSKWGTYTNYRDKYFYKVILNDGSVVIIKAQGDKCNLTDGGYSNTCGYILYDVNGEKAPNTFGKDVFSFLIMKDSIKPNKLDNCKKSSTDRQCTGAAAHIILNGNMNYLH